MEKVNIGIIGLGYFGEVHADVFSKLPGANLLAVCTRREWRLKEVAEKYDVPKTYSDYNEMLADDEIDAVSIVTHAPDHVAPTVAAFKAGKHVLLEKPMALTTAECDTILEAAAASPKCFMVGHICRFNARYAMAKKAIDDGAVGKILSIHARRNIPGGVAESHLEKLSSLTGDGIHDTDLMLWFTGEKVKTVYATTVRANKKTKHPDIGWAVYGFESGCVGVIESAWCLPDSTPYPLDERMEIIGEKGAIYINEGSQPLVINNGEGVKYAETIYWPVVHGVRSGALRDELAYFVECVLTDKAPQITTPEESRRAVAVIEAAEKSAETGQVIAVNSE